MMTMPRSRMALGRVAAWQLVRDSARQQRVHRLLRPVPDSLRLASLEAGRLGLQRVTVRMVVLEASELALAQLIAVDVSQQILVEVVVGFGSDAPAPRWDMKSLVGDLPSLLLTTTRHPMPCARHEIAQTLPSASPAQLLDGHCDALDLIVEAGIAVIEVVDAVTMSADAHRLLGQPAREARLATAKVLRANLRSGRDEAVGLLRDRAHGLDPLRATHDRAQPPAP